MTETEEVKTYLCSCGHLEKLEFVRQTKDGKKLCFGCWHNHLSNNNQKKSNQSDTKKKTLNFPYRKTIRLTKSQFDNWDPEKVRQLIDKYIIGDE